MSRTRGVLCQTAGNLRQEARRTPVGAVDAGRFLCRSAHAAKHRENQLPVTVARYGGTLTPEDLKKWAGEMGLTTDLPIERMWRDQRSFVITEGPTEILKMALARHVLRQYGG
ncbi:MAG: acyl-CoA dehydrogenase [Alphaproteobacteria bacterium]|nr:acyl-CoA dehydrogenase [Alphaproteobacteria bacterium]